MNCQRCPFNSVYLASVPAEQKHTIAALIIRVKNGFRQYLLRPRGQTAFRRSLTLLLLVPLASVVHAERSLIQLPVSVSMEAVRAKIDAAVPAVLVDQPATRHICVPATWVSTKIPEFRGWKWYTKTIKTKSSPEISCDVSASVSRAGPVTIEPDGNSLVGTVTLNGQATVRGRGAIGQNIRETASGTLRVTIRLTPALAPDWTLSASPQISFVWLQKPTAVLFNVIPVTFEGEANNKLDQLRGQIIADIESQLRSLPIKQQVEQQWTRLHEPLALMADENLFLRLRPRRIGLSGLTAGPERLSVSFMLEADTEVTLGKPASQSRQPLPTLQRVASTSSGFRLALPISVGYQALGEQLAALLDVPAEKPIDTPLGTLTTLHVDTPVIKRLGSSELQIEFRSRITGADGSSVPLTLQLSATLDINPQSHQFTVDLPSSTLQVGQSGHASVLYALLFQKLSSRIEQEFIVDFSDDWNRLTQRLKNLKSVDLGSGVRLITRFNSPRYSDLRISPSDVSLMASATGTAEIVVTP